MLKHKYQSLFQLMIVLFILAACASSPYRVSDHYDGKKFFNPWLNVPHKSFFQLLKWQFTSEKTEWPEKVEDNQVPRVADFVSKGEVHTTFVNHATQLIQLHGMNLLTDPNLDERASPLSWVGPHRHRSPGIEFKDLPKIETVLISHNHYDHLSVNTIKNLTDKFNPTFIVPIGNKKLLDSAGAKKVIELDWWEKTTLENGVEIHCVPVQHWSARGFFDRNEALWSGFVILAFGKKIYFGGDTGYGPHFKETHKKFGKMDLAYLPIGAYEPRWFMKDYHLNPEEAVQASLDLEATISIGIHFGTFQLTDEGIENPVEDLNSALQKYNIKPEKFLAPKNGQTTILK